MTKESECEICPPMDLNRHFIKNPNATFFMRCTGDSMIGAGIHPDDILIVDRSLEARDKSVIIAVVNREFTVKRLRLKGGKGYLVPENTEYNTVEITEGMDFEVWGVVTSVVHSL